MDKDSKEALQVTKEIVVKFIETGRVSPATVGEVFPAIYGKVLETIRATLPSPEGAGQPARVNASAPLVRVVVPAEPGKGSAS